MPSGNFRVLSMGVGSDFESEGREFESLRARQQPVEIDSEFLREILVLDIAVLRGSTGATRDSVSPRVVASARTEL